MRAPTLLALAVAGVLASAAPASAATAPVAAYGFEEGTGATVTDGSGNGNDGTLEGPTRLTAGKFGSALSFDGVNDLVTVADSATLDLSGAATIEAWVYPTKAAGYRTLVMKEAPGRYAWALYGSSSSGPPNGRVVTSADFDVSGPGKLPLNVWAHLALTYDGTKLALYVNGQKTTERAVTGTITTSDGALRFGGNRIWANEWFKGRLDEVRIYDRALTAAEVEADMATPVGGEPAPPPPPVGDPTQVGSWTPAAEWPLVTVHAQVLGNGKVLVWDGQELAPDSNRIWDPATNTFAAVPYGRNLFCAAHVNLPDGRALIAGGHRLAYFGLADTSIFDWRSNTWTRAADMARQRWYPTTVTLPDGRVLVASGDNVSLNVPNQPVALTNQSDTLPEIYDVDADTWTPVPTARRVMPLYPQFHVLPDGTVADVGPDMRTRTLDVVTGRWTDGPVSEFDGNSSVQYRPGRILKAGSWADPAFPGRPVGNKAASIDFAAAQPQWAPRASMHKPRAYHTLTALPDGTVLAGPGERESDGLDPVHAEKSAEIWNPETDTWSLMASATVPRMYHTTQVLLPDGRVLVAGSGRINGAASQSNAEIFSPPYLFKGARPAITFAPGQLTHGNGFTIDTPDAARVRSVALTHTPSVTHGFDFDNRYVPLDFSRSGNTLSVQGPANANVVPPGTYYLWIVDDKGVPSVARIVSVPVPQTDTLPPAAPPNLVATGGAEQVELSWDAATDNVGVARYNVHRSTTPGFEPTAANRVGSTSGRSFADTGLAPGTYHYVVTAEDAAGNVSTSSREESAQAQPPADTTPPTVPGGLTATGGTDAVELAWAASTDASGVAEYRIHRGAPGFTPTAANRIATIPQTTFRDTPLAPGRHAYRVVAVDAAGNASAPSAEASADVALPPDTAAPQVALTAPEAGTTVGGTVALRATADDDRGVEGVQFRVDGANLGPEDHSAPYELQWDTRLAPDGPHELTAVARDAAGNTTTAAAVTVTVANVSSGGGPVAAYGFEEESGTTTADRSGHGNTGTLDGPARSTAGRFGRALAFDGTNDLVTVPDSASLDFTSGLTMAAWVFPTNVAGYKTVVMKQTQDFYAWALYGANSTGFANGRVVTAADMEARNTAKLPLSTWSHLAATYDGATVRLYVNGVERAQRAAVGPIALSDGPLQIGGNTVWREWFKGRLDEVRVYDRALSPAELQADAATPVG